MVNMAMRVQQLLGFQLIIANKIRQYLLLAACVTPGVNNHTRFCFIKQNVCIFLKIVKSELLYSYHFGCIIILL